MHYYAVQCLSPGRGRPFWQICRATSLRAAQRVCRIICSRRVRFPGPWRKLQPKPGKTGPFYYPAFFNDPARR